MYFPTAFLFYRLSMFSCLRIILEVPVRKGSAANTGLRRAVRVIRHYKAVLLRSSIQVAVYRHLRTAAAINPSVIFSSAFPYVNTQIYSLRHLRPIARKKIIKKEKKNHSLSSCLRDL